MPDCDLAVIGAGAAGLSVTAAAAQLGLRVALIERDRMGGDCLNAGCVPSKALLAAAHAMEAIRNTGRFGIQVAEPTIDWDALRRHVQGVISGIAPVDSAQRFRALGATVMEAEARFVAPDTLLVDGHPLTASRFVIAAGSRPAVPPIQGLDHAPYWTNANLFELAERPDHLLILGGGPFGLEMADAFRGLGCRVTLVEAASIAAREDPELVTGLRAALVRRGVMLLEGVTVEAVERGPVLILSDGTCIAGSHLLVAAGRRSNLEALDLPAGRVEATPAGIAVDRSLRSVSNDRVYAVGDIADPTGIGPRAFTHIAGAHAALFVRHVLFRLPGKVDYGALPRVIYTSPELAQAGMTEAEARAAGLTVQVLRWPLADNDRAAAERDPDGLVKLVASGGRLVGAGILSANAAEMIGLWALAIGQRTRLSALAGMILPYPTRNEAGKRAAGSAFAEKLFAPTTKSLARLLARLP